MDATELEEIMKSLGNISLPKGDVVATDSLEHSSGLQVWDEEVSSWIPVQRPLWRSWTGMRAVWGIDYHGPVYSIDSKTDSVPWTGPRICPCDKCQQHVSSESRTN